jgi:hypothetical protein
VLSVNNIVILDLRSDSKSSLKIELEKLFTSYLELVIKNFEIFAFIFKKIIKLIHI